jgi:hypothetical protein
MAPTTYADIMTDDVPYIELRIDLAEPPELFDLIGALAADGRQFDEYIARLHPGLAGEARLFVREIRKGSTILDLVPHIPALIATMDAVLIVDNFVTRYRGLLQAFVRGDTPKDIAKNDVKDFLDTVKLIAKDHKGKATITSAVFREEGSERRVELQFTTGEAQQARQLLERKTIEMESPIFETKENVLMAFWQSNLKDPKTGKPTGEKAIIEAVSSKPLAVIYETDSARQQIKRETEQGDRNLYKIGFYVDCYVERLRGKPVAYRVTAVRNIIDLPDDED